VRTPPPVQIDVERDGERYAVRAAVRIDAPPKLVWDTLTDYERIRDFMPGVQHSRVLTRDGNRLTVEHRGEYSVLFFVRPVRVRFAVEHTPFVTIVARGLPQLADGSASTLREFNGRYDLSVVRDGEVQLVYEARFELAEALPPLIGPLFGTAAMRSTLRADFDALVREVARRRAARPAIEKAR
jgi:carbon monoxide dehydrogenase subunit G